jgi:uncharacterized protein (DUF58 family)
MEVREERISSAFIIPFVLFFMGLFLFLSLLHNQRDLTVLTILIFVVVAGAKIWGWMSLSGLKCRVSLDKVKCFPDEDFTLKIHVENPKWLPLWLQAKLDAAGFLGPLSDEEMPVLESGLLWRQQVDFPWRLTARKRGVYPVGPIRLLAGDLLGFFPRQRLVEAPDIIVFPRIVPLKTLPLKRNDLFGVPGANSPVQDPIYILGTRDYQHSQPARYIHWKASARHDRLQEKVFDPSEQARVLIVIDAESFSRGRDEEAFEKALEVAASLALRFDRQGYAFGLVTNGEVVGECPTLLPVARNPRQLPKTLEILARLRMSAYGGLEDMLTRELSLQWGVSAVLLAHEADMSVLSIKESLVRRRIPTLLLVNRPYSSPYGQDRESSGIIYRLEDIRFEAREGE